MVRLLLSLIILTSGADALFGISSKKSSQTQQHQSESSKKPSLFGKIKSKISSSSTSKKSTSTSHSTSQKKPSILSKIKSKVSSSPKKEESPSTHSTPTKKPSILSKIKSKVSSSKKKEDTHEEHSTQGGTPKKSGLFSKLKSKVSSIGKKKTSQGEEAQSEGGLGEQGETPKKKGLFSKFKSKVSSIGKKKTSQGEEAQGEEGLGEQGETPKKKGLFSKFKSKVSSIGKKKTSQGEEAQDEEDISEQGETPKKKGLFSKLKSKVSSIGKKKTPQGEETQDEDGLGEQGEGAESGEDLEEQGDQPKKSGFFSKLKNKIAPSHHSDGTPHSGLLTRVKKGTMNLVSSTKCTAAKCSDEHFMTPQQAQSCLSTVGRARTNIHCSKSFFDHFCQSEDTGDYAQSCETANEAIQAGGSGLGKITGVAGRIKNKLECTADYCSNPNLGRNELYKCVGTPKLVQRHGDCANAYFMAHCGSDSTSESPHGAEFCDAIKLYRGEPKTKQVKTEPEHEEPEVKQGEPEPEHEEPGVKQGEPGTVSPIIPKIGGSCQGTITYRDMTGTGGHSTGTDNGDD